MKQYIPNEQLYMYRMETNPLKMPLNDYILQYKQTNDEKYLKYFLHFYEPKLNKRIKDYCENYGIFNHFQDIKQVIITTIIMKIDKYEPTADASLITYTKKHVNAAVHDYIRKNCGILYASEYDYDNLRNIKVIFNEKSELTEIEQLQIAMDKTRLSKEKILEHIQYGDMFQYSKNLTDEQYVDEDDYLQLIDNIEDINENSEYIVINKLFYEALITAIDGLPYKEKHLITRYYGLKTDRNRFIKVKPIQKKFLAAFLHVGKIQSVDNNVLRAVKLLRTELEKQGWI